MKKFVLFPLFSIVALVPLTISNNPKGAFAVSGCNYVTALPTSIKLSDCGESEIRNYYASLNSLSDSELQGENLLKNLKPILFNMNYFSYDNVWKIYEITDRDWELSPKESITYGTYNNVSDSFENYQYGSNSSKKNDPYVRTLYRDYSLESAKVKNWDSHNTETNREHVWCQSRGFKAPSGAKGPAGTDVHHLISGDAKVNTAIHNNNPYGYVYANDFPTPEGREDIAGNLKGTAVHTFTADESTTVFEPRDEYKGDIARACFYMAARYNNLSGTDEITQYEPNLKLVNYATSNGEREDSSAEHAVGMGILQDLLEWNKLDPVDEFEIHRNNLIYNNFQGNRNPFIDFPEWADYIWGVSEDGIYNSTPIGRADPQKDAINGIEKVIPPEDPTTSSSVTSSSIPNTSTSESTSILTSQNTSEPTTTQTSAPTSEPTSVPTSTPTSTPTSIPTSQATGTSATSASVIPVSFDPKVALFIIAGAVGIIVVASIIALATKNNKKAPPKKRRK